MEPRCAAEHGCFSVDVQLPVNVGTDPMLSTDLVGTVCSCLAEALGVCVASASIVQEGWRFRGDPATGCSRMAGPCPPAGSAEAGVVEIGSHPFGTPLVSGGGEDGVVEKRKGTGHLSDPIPALASDRAHPVPGTECAGDNCGRCRVASCR